MTTTHYNNGKTKWHYKERMKGRDEWHSFLGPCPFCGTPTFDYGGGWRCLAMYCNNNTSNPIGTLGKEPEWWNTGMQVFMDGDTWCAVGKDFIDLQSSNAGFGNTPQKAVDELYKSIGSVHDTTAQP